MDNRTWTEDLQRLERELRDIFNVDEIDTLKDKTHKIFSANYKANSDENKKAWGHISKILALPITKATDEAKYKAIVEELAAIVSDNASLKQVQIHRINTILKDEGNLGNIVIPRY